MAREARERARSLVEAQPGRHPDDAIVAIILAAAAIEGFINEIGETIRGTDPDYVAQKGFTSYLELSHVVREIEESRGSTELKYLMASKILSGKMHDRGAAPMQDVIMLMKIRHHIMHPKPIDQKINITGSGPRLIQSEMPAFIKTLQARGLARPQHTGSWLEALKSLEMASWACEVSMGIMKITAGMLPNPFNRMYTNFLEEFEAGVRSNEGYIMVGPQKLATPP